MNIAKFFNKLAIAAVCTISLAAGAHASPAFDVDPYSIVDYDTNHYNFSVDFTANQAITVDALAYFFNTADVIGSHAVALFDMSGNKLAETIVDAGDVLLGNFRYSSINPVDLIAGASYRLVGLSEGGLYGWGAHSVDVDPAISFLQSGFADAAGGSPDFDNGTSWGAHGDPLDSIWGASMSFNPTRAEVPEPATYALLIAGMGLLFIARRRKSS